MQQNQLNIKNYTIEELRTLFQEQGIEPFRASQVITQVYRHKRYDFRDMTDLPVEMRDEFAEKFMAKSLKLVTRQYSTDGTQKFLYELADGKKVESVLIPAAKEYDDRLTLCISSQVGCGMDCSFCATGKLGLTRNLEPAEIIDQMLITEEVTGEKITNIVYMGMGEPLQNFDNVMKAHLFFTGKDYLNMGVNRITVSTSGIIKNIDRLLRDNLKVKLALSLHATTQGVREKLMPIARKNRLKDLMNKLEEYYRAFRIPVTFEYIVFDGLNDSEEDIMRLKRFTGRFPSKINLIPFHDISFTGVSGFAAELKPAGRARLLWFADELHRNGVNTFLRTSSGEDIDAACGQLAFSMKSK